MKKIFILLAAVIFTANVFAQWKELSFPSATIVTFLAVKDSTIYAATGGQGVFLSTDSGTSWTAVNNGLTNHIVQAFAINGSTIYAGTSNNNGWGTGVFASTNNGSSWSLLGLNQTSIYIQALAFNGSTIIAGDGYGSGILLSKDNGSTWQESNNGLPSGVIVWSLIKNDTNIFAGTNKGVYLSANNGSSWTAMNIGLPDSSNVSTLAISASGSIFAGTFRKGVFLSADHGASWNAVNTGLDSSGSLTISALAIMGSTIFAGTADGVYVSANNGASWINMSYGLSYPAYAQGNVYSLAIINGCNIFAGTYNSVWKSAGYAYITPEGSTTFCQGDSVILDAGPHASPLLYSGLSYQWLNNGVTIKGATNSSHTAASAGKYQVIVTDTCGSATSDTTTVTVNPKPAKPKIILKNDTLFSNALAGNQWYNIQSGIIDNATDSIYIPSRSGDYFVIVTKNGCSSDSSNIFNYTSVGIAVLSNKSTINIYPNPADSKFDIEIDNQKESYTLEILNIVGQIVFTEKLNNSIEQVDLSGLSNGVYFVKLQSASNTIVRKIIKQ